MGTAPHAAKKGIFREGQANSAEHMSQRIRTSLAEHSVCKIFAGESRTPDTQSIFHERTGSVHVVACYGFRLLISLHKSHGLIGQPTHGHAPTDLA